MWIFMLFAIIIFLSILTLILIVLKLIFKKQIFSKIIICLWGLPIILSFVMMMINPFVTKMELEKNEIYGNYIIDREKCAGKQADWQYNHYRFKITEDNKIYFYITENEKIIKTIVGKIEINEFSANPHLKLILNKPKFHIINHNPTLYREIWSFYYVFYSDKYQNVFFKKGNWKSIN